MSEQRPLADHEQGFILTRNQKDIGGQTVIELWLTTPNGPVKLVTPPQESTFFIQHTQTERAKRYLEKSTIGFSLRDVALKTFEHEAVSAIYFPKPSAAYQARDILLTAGIECYEYDIRLAERFLMERFSYGSVTYAGHLHQEKGYQVFSQARVKSGDYQPSFRVLSLDIECGPSGELYSIGLAAKDYQCVLMVGQPKQNTPEENPDWIRWVTNERALLIGLIEEVNAYNPDIFVGWSVVQFDFKLLIKRAEKHRIPLTLSRDNSPISWREGRADSNQGFVNMTGRIIVDGIDALKTATYVFDSFSLEFVAQALLGKGKATDDVDNRVEHINHDFKHNKVKLAKYNLQDCELVNEIFEHTKLLDFLTLRSQLTGLELDRAGGSVAAFVNLYLPKLHRAGYIAPNRPVGGGLASPGGYVMDSQPGIYNHVLVLDFKSLYPSIIRTFKIDPLGLVEGLQTPENAIPGFRGGQFSREKHFLPDIITSLWQQRDEAKKSKDAARSQAIKILMNSFYGVLGSGGCPFYDTRLASSITMRGHDIMQSTAKWITEKGHKVIYGDTDSTFVWLEGE
ncbi:MAG: DNA polymerase II, partial [Pseudomonadota bacterium]